MLGRRRSRRGRAGLTLSLTVAGGAALLMAGGTPPLAQAAEPQASLVSGVVSDSDPVVLGGQCYPGVPNPAACRRVLHLLHLPTGTSDWVYASGIVDKVQDRVTGVTTSGFHNVFRFDATTHLLDTTWQPQLYKTTTTYTDAPVTGLAGSADGAVLYVAGAFTQVAPAAGAPAQLLKGVAALGTAAGPATVQPFNAKVCVGGGPCVVNDVQLVNGTLWLGGLFTHVAKTPVTALAFVDPVTAALRPVQVPISGVVTSTVGTKVAAVAINPQVTQAVMIGNFASVGGSTHQEVAVLDITSDGTASTDPWNAPTNLAASGPACNAKDTWARGVDWDPTGTYFDIAASGGGGFDAYPALCDSFSRFASDGNPNTPYPLVVNATGFDSEFTVCDTGGIAYVGGHFKNQNHVVRINGVVKKLKGRADENHYGLAALTMDPLDPNYGFAVQSWNNTTTTGRGAGWASCLSRATVAAQGGGVYFGGDANVVMGDTGVQRLAWFPSAV